MQVKFRKTLPNGRRILVYEGENEVVVLTRENGAKTRVVKTLFRDEGIFWREKLAEILGVTEEDLK